MTKQPILSSCLLAAAIFHAAPPAIASACREAYQRQDYKTAHPLCLRLAKEGNAEAQTHLGKIYYEGKGVPQNYLEALRWYRAAAAQGYAKAQADLGLIYYRGRAVRRDFAAAARWFRKAADQKHAGGQYLLGVMHEYEMGGVPKDWGEALRLYRLAGAGGDVIAQTRLGQIYHSGEGAPRDYAESVRWYRAAAAQGQPEAQARLARMYYRGDGVARDYVEAYRWASVFGLRFPKDAADFLADLEKVMTRDQIAEAKARAREN